MIKFSEKQIKELADAITDNGGSIQYKRRVQAVYCIAIGETFDRAAELTLFNRRWITALKQKYLAEGLDGLKSKYKGANYRKLTAEEESRILLELSQRATLGEYVRSKELKAAFESESGVTYHANAFRQLLKRHGWRKVAPRGAHPKKASEEAIETSKKLTLWSRPKNLYPQKTEE